jgi:hypothetical protein
MIGSLLYLMATRSDIQFSVCLCAHFQASPRLRIGKQSSAYSGICDTLPSSAFGTLRLPLWLFMDFRMRILSGVS